MADSGAVAPVGLDEFLAVDNTRPGQTTARLGRIVGFLALVVVLGLLAFLATTLVGRIDELRAAFTAVRLLGVGLVVGSAIEYVGVARISGDGIGSVWTSSAGFSTMLRMLGGVVLAAGFVPTIKRLRRASVSLSAAVIEAPRRSPVHEMAPEIDHASLTGDPRRAPNQQVRWKPDQAAWTIGVAVGTILLSFLFDGHTVSKGPRALHALFDVVHVAAGSVWAGGVISLVAVLWRRHLRGQPGNMPELVIRFSGIATLALGAVTLAGLIMSVFVLDSVGELTGTVWGKILLLKTAAVALAACGGAYNHFRLLPALEVDPDDPTLLAEIRSTVTAEGILLVFVVIVTASLVAAAS
jgi:copper transport protein